MPGLLERSRAKRGKRGVGVRLLFACISCYVRAYPNRALGLTSQKPKPCLECGDEAIGVMVDSKTYRGQVLYLSRQSDMGPPGDEEYGDEYEGDEQGSLF